MIEEKIVPQQKQLDFLDWEFGVFFHFGIRSFFKGHKDWDNINMPASQFNPTNLDCDQWVRTAYEAGARYTILVCKHHDGFANWPSSYTDYSVKATPWKGGQGDVVAEYVAACQKYGMKTGLYYSPAQWGGESAAKNGKEDDDYFLHQIPELLTNYGKIDYLWFDGCGSENHQYDTKRILREIRALQPHILIFEMWDPDVRWVGNEDGYADSPNFNTVNALDFSMNTQQKKALVAPRFLPAECDFMMRDTWFDCEDNEAKVKSVEELMGIYELSVGRGANFLINIGPDARGLLPQKDAQRLLAFGRELKKRYGKPVEGFFPLQATEVEPNSFTITTPLKEGQLINRIILQEDLTQGESISEFCLYAHLPRYAAKRICIYRGTTIGHKAICLFSTIRTSQVTIEVKGHKGNYKLKSMKPYLV